MLLGLPQDLADGSADARHLMGQGLEIGLTAIHQGKGESSTGVDDVVRDIGDLSIQKPLGIRGLGELIVGGPRNDAAAKSGNGLGVENRADGTRCLDIAISRIHGLRCHDLSPQLAR